MHVEEHVFSHMPVSSGPQVVDTLSLAYPSNNMMPTAVAV